jgi:putative transcriptional regulator
MEEFRSHKGQYLLDSGKLTGSFFEKTVIFLCQHDEKGAFGFVVNRPSGARLGNVVDMSLPGTLSEMELFLGGPVQTEILSYLHADTSLMQTNIVPGIEFGNSVEGLMEIASNFSPSRNLKVFGGYAGWGPGQLEAELEQGAWFLHRSSTDYLFSYPSRDLWAMILCEMGPQYRLIAQAPDNPSLN